LTGIVTALHGVVGCASIRVRSTSGGLVLRDPLQIGQLDIDNDAAALISFELLSKPADGFEWENAQRLAGGDRVTVQGHPFGINFLTTSFALRDPPKVPLRDLVSNDVAIRLIDRNSPNAQVPVLSLERGNLLPGHSGAPVINTKGRVVGMADGGLKGGTVQISWAIPYELIRWTPPKPTKRYGDLKAAAGEELFQYEASESGQIPPRATGASRVESPSDRAPVEMEGFLFQINSCSASPNQVLCKFTITSPGKDRMIVVGANRCCAVTLSTLFDQAGNESYNSMVALGSKRGTDSVRALLVRNIPVMGEIQFNIASDVNFISLLRLECAGERDFFTVLFRDIRVSQRP
jgi:hypothetical protein